MVKKLTIVTFVGMLLIIVLFGCGHHNDISQIQVDATITSAYEPAYNETQIIYDADGVANWYCEIYDDRLVYLNYRSDYKITLPLSWKGNFRINTVGSSIQILFWGMSDVGYMPSEESYIGLTMFLIVPESVLEGSTLDGVAYIGTSGDINYYYATFTDCEICALIEELQDYENGISKYQDDPEQIELIRKDYETVQKMREDFDYKDLDFQPME